MFYDNYDEWWDNEPTAEELNQIESELAASHDDAK